MADRSTGPACSASSPEGSRRSSPTLFLQGTFSSSHWRTTLKPQVLRRDTWRGRPRSFPILTCSKRLLQAGESAEAYRGLGAARHGWPSTPQTSVAAFHNEGCLLPRPARGCGKMPRAQAQCAASGPELRPARRECVLFQVREFEGTEGWSRRPAWMPGRRTADRAATRRRIDMRLQLALNVRDIEACCGG